MTVAELINRLEKLPGWAPIYIESNIGYLTADRVVAMWTDEPTGGIITTSDAREDRGPGGGFVKAFFYIGSPY